MRFIFLNLLSLSPQNISTVGLVACGLIWLGVWAVVISDIIAAEKSPAWKGAWLIIGSAPGVGGILYSLRCLLTANWAAAFFWRKLPAPVAGKKGTSPAVKGSK